MIQMTNIHKDFGDNEVLKGVDFTLKPGTVHALMGEKWGKSTLMKILVGIHKKTKVLSLILILRSTITILKKRKKRINIYSPRTEFISRINSA